MLIKFFLEKIKYFRMLIMKVKFEYLELVEGSLEGKLYLWKIVRL